MDAGEANFIGTCTIRVEVHLFQKKNQSGAGSGMVNFGQWCGGLGDAGFGALPPGNDSSQEKADESADE